MKVKFSRAVTYVPEWNHNKEQPESEQIQLVLLPMELSDLLDLMDAIEITKKEDGTTDAKVVDAKKIVKSMGHLLTKYIKEVKNLEDDNGPVTPEDMVRFPYYMDLAGETIMEIANISMLSENDEKNLKPQPALAAN